MLLTLRCLQLMPAPQGITPFSVTVEKEADLVQLIDIIQPLDLV